MTDWIHIKPTISLDLHRCFKCGRHWACEAVRHPSCPLCSAQEIQRMQKEVDRMVRSNAALRGAVTRAKKRRR